MSDLNLDNLKLSESSAPAYPEIRLRAACQEWGVQQSLELAKARADLSAAIIPEGNGEDNTPRAD